MALVALAVLLVGVTAWVVRDQGEQPDRSATDSSTAVATPTPTPTPTPTVPPPTERKPRAEPRCRATSGGFTPTSMSVRGVTPGAPVLAIPRDGNGVVGVPPLTAEGKAELAWDAPGVAPGSPAGHVLFNAHTWPDGSALGNRLLGSLQAGGRILVRGADGELACYDVSRRTEVPAETLMPEIYSPEGPPQLVIIVCSGTRRGPGDWSHRTLWFASPVAA
ncbi:class F sortase [Nocardioides sp. LHG3406-4]|uniref:class F sortase n=1 Tax=Nocardioides sp. LHG3406-4 TaxID=2804575 RepID=UPI003CF936B1